MEKSNKLRTPALVVMILMILITTGKFAAYFMAKWQLVSPLISKDTIELIRRPFLISGVLGVVVLIATFLFYKKKKYALSIVCCGINYLIQAGTIYYFQYC